MTANDPKRSLEFSAVSGVLMLHRRIFQHLRDQNWFAIGLDLIVVVVGISLAFQADRWYESRKLLADLDGYFLALADDFAETRQSLERAIDGHGRSRDAATQLINYGPEDALLIDHDQFYLLLRDVNRAQIFNPVRRTYDTMISTGAFEIIPDAELKRELTSFITVVNLIDSEHNELNDLRREVLEPFLAKNLDYVEVLRITHTEANQIELSREPYQFREILGNKEFKGLLMLKWHISHDLLGAYSNAMAHLDAIERRFEVNQKQQRTE